MFDTINIDSIKSIVIVSLMDKFSGKTIMSHRCSNLVTYDATSCLSQVYSGNSDYKIGYMYGEHADPTESGYIEGSLNSLVAAKTDNIGTMRAWPRSTTNAENRIIYPGYSTSDDSIYNNNVVTFTCSFNSDLLNGRIFVGAGLVSRPNSTEILCNHVYFPGYIKQPSNEIIIHWSVSFR